MLIASWLRRLFFLECRSSAASGLTFDGLEMFVDRNKGRQKIGKAFHLHALHAARTEPSKVP